MAGFIFLTHLFVLGCLLNSRIRLMGVNKWIINVSFSQSVTPKSPSFKPLPGTCFCDEASESVNCIWAEVFFASKFTHRGCIVWLAASSVPLWGFKVFLQCGRWIFQKPHPVAASISSPYVLSDDRNITMAAVWLLKIFVYLPICFFLVVLPFSWLIYCWTPS